MRKSKIVIQFSKKLPEVLQLLPLEKAFLKNDRIQAGKTKDRR